MTDPRLITIVSTIFAVMGTYSLYTGLRRMRDMRRVGQPVRWYKQVSVLTGLEYILLTFVFLLTLANREASSSTTAFTIPLYFALLICAAIVAGLVIRQGILDMRTARVRRAGIATTTQLAQETVPLARPKDDLEAQMRRQRERRKNAAAARRRRAGRA